MTYFALIEHGHSHTLLITQIMPIEPCSIATSFQTPILVLAWINTHTRSAALRDWDIVLSDSPSHGCIPAKHQNNTFVSYKIHFYLLFTTTYIGARKSHQRNDATTHRHNGWVTVSLYHRVDHYSHTRTIDKPTTQHDISQTSTPTRTTSRLHTFSHSALHTHLTHTTRTTNPSDAQTLHAQLTSFPSQVTNTSSHTLNTHLTPTFTSAIPQKRPFLATFTLMPTFHHACFCHDRV